MDTIAKVESELRQGMLKNNPIQCADYRAMMAGEYSFIAGQLEGIYSLKPGQWNAMRPEFKSDAACNKWWEATEMGINETGLELRLKRTEKLMQGLGAIIRSAEGQARNQF